VSVAIWHVLLSVGALGAFVGALIRRPVIELTAMTLPTLMVAVYGVILLAYGATEGRPTLLGFGMLILTIPMCLVGRFIEVHSLPRSALR
jgi:energy-converting hydrogenase Eha subunit E